GGCESGARGQRFSFAQQFGFARSFASRRSPGFRSFSVSADACNSWVAPSGPRTVTLPWATSTLTTSPSSLSGVRDGSQGVGLLWPRAAPLHSTRPATTLAATPIQVFIDRPSPIVLRDVVDRSGSGADARADQRALARPVPAASAHGGARA